MKQILKLCTYRIIFIFYLRRPETANIAGYWLPVIFFETSRNQYIMHFFAKVLSPRIFESRKKKFGVKRCSRVLRNLRIVCRKLQKHATRCVILKNKLLQTSQTWLYLYNSLGLANTAICRCFHEFSKFVRICKILHIHI